MRVQISTGFVVAILASAAPSLAQQSFDTQDSAAQALIEAAENHDAAGLAKILGPRGRAVLTSGDPAQDKAEQSEFARLYRAKHQLKHDARDPARVIVSVGDADWPFPVPIVQAKGKWSFDASETAVEMRARHIGMNELDVIDICTGYVEAQRKYAAEDRDKDGLLAYASHMMSAPGKQDGLYWDGEGGALVPRGFAEAVRDSRNPSPKPYHGYYFRILDGQGPDAPGGAHDYRVKNMLIGGFGLVAWPARYGISGIHTFIVNQNGVVYEKDIAPAPSGGPTTVTRFDPDSSWSPAE